MVNRTQRRLARPIALKTTTFISRSLIDTATSSPRSTLLTCHAGNTIRVRPDPLSAFALLTALAFQTELVQMKQSMPTAAVFRNTISEIHDIVSNDS